MKSHVGCRLVRKLATLNELEHRNGHVVCVISPNLLAFWTYYIKVVEDTQIQSGVKCSPKNLVFNLYHLWRYSQGITPSEGIKMKRPLSLAKI